eukprot:TRINITY_DN8357_c0_g1_i2.p1 TRINITY_DN8357_c0_g1~~TRINITY_DN8357_c0_g1_i2.p1  ORF type:complete len:1182 (-),score=300.90 TRINITY_DN8357_c0_g1_i2:239-3784(-)
MAPPLATEPAVALGRWLRLAALAAALAGLAVPAQGPGEYYAKSGMIRTSVGAWNMPFNPDTRVYTISVGPRTYSVTVEVDIDFARYASSSDWPLVAVDGHESEYSQTEPVRSEVSLGTSPYEMRKNVTIVVAGPPDQIANVTAFRQTEYVLRFSRAPDLDKLLSLQALNVFGPDGKAVELSPSFATNPSARHFNAFVPLETKQVRVKPVCVQDARAVVGGPLGEKDAPAWVPVDTEATHTIINAACRYGSDRRGVVIDVQALVDLDEAMRSIRLRVLGDEGEVKQPRPDLFVVEAKSKVVQLVAAYHEARVSLLLEVPGEASYIMRIWTPSPPLEVPDVGNRTLTLVMRSGSEVRRLAVLLTRFVEPVVPPENLHNLAAERAGILVASTAASSLGIAAFSVGVAAASGYGSIRGRAVPVALRSLTLLLQFSALSDVAGTPCAWTDYVQPLRWLCLAPPAHRFADAGPLQRLAEAADPSASARPRLLGAAAATDDDAAAAAAAAARVLVTAASVLLLVFAFRLVLVARWSCCCSRFTLPHRLRLGNWEAHCLLHLLYPVSTAAVTLLQLGVSPKAEALERWPVPLQSLPLPGHARGWSILAALALGAPVLLAAWALYGVESALRRGRVLWVPRAESDDAAKGGESARSDGGGWRADAAFVGEEGFYCDARCDQLCTRLVERAICGSAFPNVHWAATVADIRPITVGTGAALSADEAYLLVGGESANESDEEWAEATPVPAVHASCAAATVEVDVTATVRLARGHQELCCAEVGRVTNVPWLEAHLSAELLIRLHQEVNPLLHDWATPVTVRVEQLHGPISAGRLAFCFDGLRWPRLVPLEFFLRLALGAATAASALPPSGDGVGGGPVLPMLLAAALTACVFLTVLHEAPCSYVLENSMTLLAHLAICIMALACVARVTEVFSTDFYSSILLLVSACALGPLLLYAFLAAAALLAGVACPAGFDEEASCLSRCNVDLALRGPSGSWVLLAPAECKLAVTTAFVHALPTGEGNVRVHCTGDLVESGRPRLEFPVLDYLSVEHPLEPPLMVLFGKAKDPEASFEQYRAECVYADEDPWNMALEFVKRGHLPSVEYAPEIAKEILELSRQQTGAGRILVAVLVPVPRLQAPRRDELSDDGEAEEEEREALLLSSFPRQPPPTTSPSSVQRARGGAALAPGGRGAE